MSHQCMRVFQLCDIVSLSGQPIIGQLGIAITDPSVAQLIFLQFATMFSLHEHSGDLPFNKVRLIVRHVGLVA
jgi:hypothetical protein